MSGTFNETESKFFLAGNIQELFSRKKNVASLHIVGGCTYLGRLPEKSTSTSLIPELKEITKHERYIETGPGVTLAELERIGERHLPKILYDAVVKIANPFVRNIATIGGNICAKEHKLGLFAPLLALNAQIELKTQKKSQIESKFISFQNFTELPEESILSKIRIPLNEWDVSVYVRLGPANRISSETAGFAFLAASEKRALSSISIAFAGPFAFRSSSLENRLLGRRLPLAYSEIESLIEEAENSFDSAAENRNYEPILKKQFLNLVRYSLEQLT